MDRRCPPWIAGYTAEGQLVSMEGVGQLLVFSSLVLAITLYGLTVAIYFPKHARSETPLDWPMRLLIGVTIPVIALSAVHAFGFALSRLAGPAAIIGAGLAMLLAPVVLKRFSDSVVDGRVGLVAFAVLTGLLAFLTQRLAA